MTYLLPSRYERFSNMFCKNVTVFQSLDSKKVGKSKWSLVLIWNPLSWKSSSGPSISNNKSMTDLMTSLSSSTLIPIPSEL
jgi:hypothetical protein